tara:strand:+ start:5486 stop:6544 length:1059 start_codon:yes stop_codon:yes gene_type:complete
MADTTEGQTDSLTKTVEPQDNLDQTGLADLLKDTLERDEQPEPQPPAAEEEQSEESEPSEEASVSAEEETDTDLSQTETTDAEAEQAAEEDDGDEDRLTADVQASVDKRIGKEVRKRKEALEAKEAAETEAAELKRKLEEAEMRAKEAGDAAEFVPQPTEANPFANLNTLEEVQQEMMRAEQTMEWAEDNPDGAVIETKEGEREFTADEVREIKKKASRALRRQLPEQQGFIQTRDHLEPKVLEAFPWWKDKASNEFQSAMQLLRQMPELAKFPDYKFVVGDYLAGREMRENPPKKQAAAKVVKKAPSQPTAPSAEPAPVDPAAVRSASAMKSFQETGGVDELANLLKQGNL